MWCFEKQKNRVYSGWVSLVLLFTFSYLLVTPNGFSTTVTSNRSIRAEVSVFSPTSSCHLIFFSAYAKKDCGRTESVHLLCRVPNLKCDLTRWVFGGPRLGWRTTVLRSRTLGSDSAQGMRGPTVITLNFTKEKKIQIVKPIPTCKTPL